MCDGLSNMPASLFRQLRARNTFVQQVASTFAVQSLTLVFGIGAGVIMARWLGPAGKGLYQLGLLLPAMLGLFLSGGINAANVYYTGSRQFSTATLMAHSVGMAIGAAVVGSAVAVLLVVTGWIEVLVPGLPTWLVVVGMLCLPLNLLQTYFSAILQGMQRILVANTITLVQSIVLFSLTALLVIGFNLGLPGAIAAYLCAVLFGLTLAALILVRAGGTLRPRWDRSVLRRLFAYGLKGHPGNLLQFFNYRLDGFVVNYYLGAGSMGIYSVAVRLAELLWRFPSAVGFVIFPKAAASQASDMNRLTARIFWFTLGITVVGATVLVLVGRPLILLIYAQEFAGAYAPMLALLPGVTLLGAAKVLTNEIAGRGYPQYNSLAAGVSLLLTVTLDLILIPRWGITGAAVASSVAYTVTFCAALLSYLYVRRRSSLAVLTG